MFGMIGLAFCMIPCALKSQNQNNFWAYGYQAGINFNTTPPSYVGGNSMNASEGAASVADPVTGNLLFYTNGVTVWDAANNPMPNGTGLLGGTAQLLSSTTAAVICEKPGSPNQYYVFTIDEQASNNGVRYSVVNMALNGGMGDIVSGKKNIPLLSTNSEKMCIAPNGQGTGYWLVTHDGSNTFYAFSVTASGVSNTAVTSAVSGSMGNGAGFMKISPQLDRLAVTNLFFQDVELFQFNRNTGVISQPIVLSFPFSGAAGGPYGIEFSCSGQFLYVTDGSNLRQFDLSSGNATGILASAYSVLSNSFSCYGLQLGPDLKIYVSNGALDVIENPELAGAACGYTPGAIPNQMSGGGWGLPQWVYRVGDGPVACSTCSTTNTSTNITACNTYVLPDGTTVSNSNQYTLTLQSAAGCDSIVTYNITIATPPIVTVSATPSLCGNETEFNASASGNGPYQYGVAGTGLQNTTGDFTLDYGIYELTVTDANGCSSTTLLDNINVVSCPADFNQDFVVGVSDLLEFNAAYGCLGNCCPYDLNEDAAVSVADLLLFISAFGDWCE